MVWEESQCDKVNSLIGKTWPCFFPSYQTLTQMDGMGAIVFLQATKSHRS